MQSRWACNGIDRQAPGLRTFEHIVGSKNNARAEARSGRCAQRTEPRRGFSSARACLARNALCVSLSFPLPSASSRSPARAAPSSGGRARFVGRDALAVICITCVVSSACAATTETTTAAVMLALPCLRYANDPFAVVSRAATYASFICSRGPNSSPIPISPNPQARSPRSRSQGNNKRGTRAGLAFLLVVSDDAGAPRRQRGIVRSARRRRRRTSWGGWSGAGASPPGATMTRMTRSARCAARTWT